MYFRRLRANCFELLLIYSVFIKNLFATPIVGGIYVQSVGALPKYPFVVSLQDRIEGVGGTFQYQHFCGGSLISSKWILTAAHCIWRKNVERIIAIIGQENISTFLHLRHYEIASVEYTNFQLSSLYNDIALLRLEQPYEPPFISAEQIGSQNYAKLPKFGMKPSRKKPCKIIGYGANHHTGQPQSNLLEGEVHVISNKRCQKLVGRIWAPQEGDNTVCALSAVQDTCDGDSGGPLICTYEGQDYVYGIVSYGISCGIPNVPGIYTVTMPYLKWIRSIIN